jgi:hypothetical protein
VKLVLERLQLAPDFTIGKLAVDGEFECWTLEDTVRAEGVKVAGATAIPYGTYKVALTFSNRFQRVMPLLVDVPGFAGVRIHSGNFSTDTEGCILVGLDRGLASIGRSKTAFNALLKKLTDAAPKGAITIEVTKPQAGDVVG